MSTEASNSLVNAYGRDGYVVLAKLFDTDEIDLLDQTASSELPAGDVLTKQDRAGNKVTLKMWNSATDDVYGMFSRNERVVDIARKLLGEDVYLYSAKMILKNAREGGAWEWHQDYGYWYNNGCLAPTMTSCMVAIDRNTTENGCLQVLRGSHQLGRIDHERCGEQTVADSERVAIALERFDCIHIPLDPGDALFFHCNLLHRSDANNSAMRRWNYICSYNTINNRPYKKMREYGHDADLVPVPSDAVRARMSRNY